MNSTDSVLRAITDDGAFRVITARTTQMVTQASLVQRCAGATAKTFAELLTGAVLFRETMAPDLRVQGILKGAGGKGSLVADSHPSGSTRGLVQMPEGMTEFQLGDDAILQMMRTMPNGRINQGVVQVPREGGISEALMVYMQTSEQVDTMLAVSALLNHSGQIEAAGGYLVQLLPEMGRGPLMLMTERLADFQNIDQQLGTDSFSPESLMNELLYGMPFTLLDKDDVSFGCWCSELRLISALSTLSRSEIENLVKDGQVLEINCDYCAKEYRIPPAKLQGLLNES
jgi:molecular chaperone Hsp33